MIHKVVDIVADVSRDDFPIFDYRESLVPIASGIRRYDNLPTPLDKTHNLLDKFIDIYEALLDFYSFQELESFRVEFGDQILWQIYNDEIAYYYKH